MTEQSAMLVYSLPESYPAAVRRVRRAIAQQELRVPAEFDVPAHFRHELGAVLSPCLVLYVDVPALLLEAIVFHPGAALLMPQPVVISGNERRSKVRVLNVEALLGRDLPSSVEEPLMALHTRILKALESVAEREAAPVFVAPN